MCVFMHSYPHINVSFLHSTQEDENQCAINTDLRLCVKKKTVCVYLHLYQGTLNKVKKTIIMFNGEEIMGKSEKRK